MNYMKWLWVSLVLLLEIDINSCADCQYFGTSSGGVCTCPTGYYLNTDTDTQFCDLCHTSCAICYGSLQTNCITCSDRFDFVVQNSTCAPPYNLTDLTIVKGYSFQGFTKMSGWTLNYFSGLTYQCGKITLLGGIITNDASRNIYVDVNSLPNHYAIRVKVNYYFLGANGTSKTATIKVDSTSAQVTGTDTTYPFHTCSNTGLSYVYRAVDVSISHSGTSARVKFQTNITGSTLHYGIRDVFIIVKRCHSDCATCTGYDNDQCNSCTDSNRDPHPSSPGLCKCKGSYFQEPYGGQCVNPCPSIPNKLYGDSASRDCVQNCPTGQFKSDDTYTCEADCPTTSASSLKLFRDYTNYKCVANCPSTQPYADEPTRKCYAYRNCPNSKNSLNTTTMRCVTSCPHPIKDGNSGIYKTYSHNNGTGKACIPYCPVNQWAHPGAAQCQNTCDDTTIYKYMDDSTGQNLCVSVCPAPNRFSSPNNYCVQICPDNYNGDQYFGDSNGRICRTKCLSPNWGLRSYNRKCVAKCPSGTWAEPSTRICVQSTLQCDPKYANSYLRQCVVPLNCQFGKFADSTTWDCVTYCPDGSYGNPDTKKCESSCISPYFADDGNNMCVRKCSTANTFATITPSRKCVTQCNQTGTLTPWADQTLKQCVSDCNTNVADFVSDNTTWKCVYQCPYPYIADRTTSIPKCVTVCPTPYYSDFSTGTGICVRTCPSTPVLFGDSYNGMNECVQVCSVGTFGDETNYRECKKTCPSPYFSQNDEIRRCVKRCNSTSFGYQQSCTYHAVNCQFSYNRVCYEDPHSCPTNYFGDNSTNLCVNPCPSIQATFGDPLSKFCIRQCPDNPDAVANSQPDTYYADPSIRQCVLTCNATHSTPLFGNNNTRTCVPVCLDKDSYAQVQTTYRLCVARCLQTPNFYYANNHTKICGPSINCPTGYYGENTTQMCVEFCPLDTINWAYKTSSDKICIDQCPHPQHGDNSTNKFICVNQCPSVPDRYADIDDRICVDTCDSGQYGNPQNRECTDLCPDTYFALDTTGRCVKKCPQGYFGDRTANVRKCWPTSAQCTSGFGDSYLRLCVNTCTGPTPVDTFGLGDDCVSFCTTGFADSHTSTRLCVPQCPGTVDSLAAPNLYGDPDTKKCVAQCITPLTWADPHTRQCEPVCSSTPALFAENFTMTCVAALDCPTSPTMTFGDSNNRYCVSFCSDGQFGDPNSRNCVDQCPKKDQIPAATQHYYGDTSTGQYLCVTICPQTPRLFGQNDSNLCVDECSGSSWGDQTGKRTCVAKCPIISGTIWYAQNQQKICVEVCKSDTWGLYPDQQCVQDPFDCGSLWADDSTHKCVSQCPQIAGLFGDPGTNKCVEKCPPNSYASDYDRTCVTGCPEHNGVHDTFANNDTLICQEYCQQDDAYADPQTLNRYCVLQCSQSPERSFADPSTKSCVPQCPTHPPLFGQLTNFKCIEQCTGNTYADTHTRLCVQNCPTDQFKLSSPQKCVIQCPSDPDLYGDQNSGFCESLCTQGWYRYSVTRVCVSSCAPYNLFQFNYKCVKFCPDGYYSNSTNNCVDTCPLNTFGQNTTTTCESTCITGYAHDGMCKAICPDGLYGQNHVCVEDCASGIASDHNNLCISTCEHGTFEENGDCQTQCTPGTYADPNTHKCQSSCTNSLFGDPNTDKCVQICPINWFRHSGLCKDDCSPLKSDNITLNCQNTCSNGTWGYQSQCILQCPGTYFGYTTDRDCYDLLSPPPGGLFADNTTKTWVQVCPENPLLFGDRNTWECVDQCTQTDQYADPYSRQCQISCTNSSYYLDQTTKACVLICPDEYFANPDTGICQSDCTNGRFNYELTHFCVTTCPKPYYGFHDTVNGIKQCLLQCPTNTFAEGDICSPGCTLPLYADQTTHRCVSDCIQSYAADNSKACETSCTQFSQIADNSTNKCVDQCPSDPDYYQENGICVMHCQQPNHYTDPTAGIRKCTTLCTEGLYGDPQSGRCVQSCLPGYFAFNDTNLCLRTCPNGFADNQTRICVANCPAPTFADSLLNKCVRICSGTQYGEGRVCVPMCSQTLFGNPITRQCQIGCPDFDYTFAQQNTNLCVKNCSIYPNQYADRSTNACVLNCTQANQYMLDVQAICTSLCPQGQFMENSTKRCQTDCDTGYAQPNSRYCVARCFGNPQTFAYETDDICVYQCKSLGLYADNTTNKCVPYNGCNTSEGYYSDPLSGWCVLFCPEGYYAQDTDWTCTTYCDTGFADNFSRKCVSKCPQSQQTYGDTNSHTCVKVCPDLQFAQNDTQQCVKAPDCPTDTWADNISKHCVDRCPSEPLYFGYNNTWTCIQQCPESQNLFGDYETQTCIGACYPVNGQYRFADPITRTCVFVCPIEDDLYGDINENSGTCLSQCKIDGWMRDNSTQRCVSVCPSDPDYYALQSEQICVRFCPDGLYTSVDAGRKCVQASICGNYGKFGDPTTNKCVTDCPEPYYADDYSDQCVLKCPSSPDYYADNYTRSCVPTCPWDQVNDQWRTFAQNINRTCVTRCPPNLFAQNSSRQCIDQCPLNEYADQIIQVCVIDCTVRPGFYKETNDRICVEQCPDGTGSYVKAFKYHVNHTCVQSSPADSGCPTIYYANTLNNFCTTICPYGYYQDSNNKYCVDVCSASQFADPADRKCKQNCTQSPNFYAFEDTENRCVQYCPQPLFSQNKTWTCTEQCPIALNGSYLYAYQITRQCVYDCPYPFFSYIENQTCLQGCPDDFFAHDQTRHCQQSCNGEYFADPSSNRCVQMCPQTPNLYGHNNQCIQNCPDDYYRDISTRQCVLQCPIQPLLYADNSTNTCVQKCPSQQDFFADNQTQKCVLLCSDGTFAEGTTRTCVQSCPDQLDTYAYQNDAQTIRNCQSNCPSSFYASDLTKECVKNCPDTPIKTYAYVDPDQPGYRKCVQRCPDGFFGNNNTLTCQLDCQDQSWEDITSNMCVSTCPLGYFAQNSTWSCVTNCENQQYADPSTRKCVNNCPGTQRLYADNTTWQCVTQCPRTSTKIYFGDTDTWTCEQICVDRDADTPLYQFQNARTCVQQCPEPYFALMSEKKCVKNCGTGLYGNSVSRKCQNCPDICVTCLSQKNCLSCTTDLYLQFGLCVQQCTLTNYIANYANDQIHSCVSANKCPSGTYGLNDTKSCESSCPTQMYANATTRTCQHCPSTCSICTSLTHCLDCTQFAEYSESDSYCYAHCNQTHQYTYDSNCHLQCPEGTYTDYTNVRCQKCNQICLTCVGNALNCTKCEGTFMLDNRCLSQCPEGYYSDARQCLQCTPDVQSCSEPLSFTTSNYIEDYKQVVVMKFNQKTIIDGDPKQFIKVKITAKRLLQDVSDLVNNGMEYQAQILPDGTIKLILAPGVSLDDVNYQVVVTDPTKIKTENGGTLQNLQSTIQMEASDIQVYPSQALQQSPLVPIAFILAIIILIITFINLIFGLIPSYMAIQAIQITSLFAYCKTIPPNLYYFLKQLRISRFTFMPTIFSSIYVQPQTVVQSIPQKVVDTEGQLSFAINGTTFFFFVFIYLLIFLIVFLLTTKHNSNRPLKNLFIKIYQTRVKFGILQDFIWLFSLNILIHSVLQFYYTQNGGQVGFGVVCMICVLCLMGGLFGYGLKRYNQQNGQQGKPKAVIYQDYKGIQDNFYMLQQGTKQQKRHFFFFFAFYLRKLLFVLLMGATMFESQIQAGLLLALFVSMMIAIVVIRPYQQHSRNFILLVNQGFMGFLAGGIIYFHKMIQLKEPSGAKITCGQVLSIVIIAHLSLVALYSIYRTYIYFKHLHEQLQKTQFYRLYLDQEYDEKLEKQISQIAGDDGGQIESIQITNIDSQQNLNQEEDEGEQIIKLKIKRKVKKSKIKEITKSRLIQQSKQTNIRKAQDFIPVPKQQNNPYYENKSKDNQYQKLQIQEDTLKQQSYNQNNQKNQVNKKNEDWVQINEINKSQQQQAVKDDKNDEYQEVESGQKVLGNIFEELQIESQQLDQNQKLEQENKENNIENQMNLTLSGNNKIQRNISSRQDFDEQNFFPRQQDQNKQQIISKQNQIAEQSQHHSYGEFDKQSLSDNKQQMQPQNNKQQIQPAHNKFQAQNNKQPQKQYDAFNIDQLLAEPDQHQKHHQQQKQSEKKEDKKNNWSVNIEDLLDEVQDKKLDEQEVKKKQKAKKMHMMLFDDDEDFD